MQYCKLIEQHFGQSSAVTPCRSQSFCLPSFRSATLGSPRFGCKAGTHSLPSNKYDL
ncbi:hypothetical protein KC19_7G041800 [Ceratodon purpureus]|uniref:Uncharacterized protein n=1 Tax=Ceratodon purpureus TaxID=3225 RepID=A0A8T0H7H3_CERPU|nr:hypothetical protein KC19_7G041800 [Ceratodon purpureus]